MIIEGINDNQVLFVVNILFNDEGVLVRLSIEDEIVENQERWVLFFHFIIFLLFEYSLELASCWSGNIAPYTPMINFLEMIDMFIITNEIIEVIKISSISFFILMITLLFFLWHPLSNSSHLLTILEPCTANHMIYCEG